MSDWCDYCRNEANKIQSELDTTKELLLEMQTNSNNAWKQLASSTERVRVLEELLRLTYPIHDNFFLNKHLGGPNSDLSEDHGIPLFLRCKEALNPQSTNPTGDK